MENQRGAVLATELKNNANKLAKWTAAALISGADMIKLGYVSRVHMRDNFHHAVLGTQVLWLTIHLAPVYKCTFEHTFCVFCFCSVAVYAADPARSISPTCASSPLRWRALRTAVAPHEAVSLYAPPHACGLAQVMKPKDFAQQINLNMDNCWGIVRALVDLCMKQEDGKYLLVKDPNKQLLRLYSVPEDAFQVRPGCSGQTLWTGHMPDHSQPCNLLNLLGYGR